MQPKCGARNRNGTTCKRPAGWGTEHNGWGNCSYHGGATPTGIKFAGRQEAEAEAGAAVLKYGLPRTVDPATAMLEEVYRSAGTVAFLGSIVAKLTDDGLVDGAAPSVWVRMFNDERKHLAQVSRSTVDAKIAERHVKVAEVVGGQLAVFARALTMALGHDPDDAGIREIVSQQFRALSA